MLLDVDLIFHMQIQVCLQRREEKNISCITPSSFFVTQKREGFSFDKNLLCIKVWLTP